MKSHDYWIGRAEANMDYLQAAADARLRTIGKAMYDAQKQLAGDAQRIFRTFANRFNLTDAEAQAALAEPLGRAEFDLLRIRIARMPEGAAKTALEIRVNSGAYAYRISRIEALRENIAIEMARVSQVLEDELTGQLRFTAVEGYNRRLFDLQRQTGDAFAVPDIYGLKVAIDTPWAGANYSSRIWGARDALASELQDVISSGFLSGKANARVAQEIRDRFSVSFRDVERLVRTETSYIAGQADKQAYRDLGIEEYEFITTLDSRTCKFCAPLDGSRHPVGAAEVGVNYPPIHPNCRCTTGMADDQPATGYRRGRDANGKSVLLPADMTYAEWQDWQLAGAPEDVRSYLQSSLKDGTMTLQNTQGLKRFRVPGVVPKGVTLTKVRSIAGGETITDFRDAQYFSSTYGGSAAEWSKRAGILETNNYVYDIHWNEWNGLQFETKVKGVRRK